MWPFRPAVVLGTVLAFAGYGFSEVKLPKLASAVNFEKTVDKPIDVVWDTTGFAMSDLGLSVASADRRTGLIVFYRPIKSDEGLKEFALTEEKAGRDGIVVGNILIADEGLGNPVARVTARQMTRVYSGAGKGQRRGLWLVSNGKLERTILETIEQNLRGTALPAHWQNTRLRLDAKRNEWDQRLIRDLFDANDPRTSEELQRSFRQTYSFPNDSVQRAAIRIGSQSGLIMGIDASELTILVPGDGEWHYLMRVTTSPDPTGGCVAEVSSPRMHLGHRPIQDFTNQQFLDRLSVELYAARRWTWLVESSAASSTGGSPKPGVRNPMDQSEIEFGHYTNAILAKNFITVRDLSLKEKVWAIGRRLADHSSQPSLSWNFDILNDPEANAFSLAGGYVFVTSGLLDLLEDEDQLAAALAHEVAHITEHDQVVSIKRADRLSRQAKVLSAFAATAMFVAAMKLDSYAGSLTVRRNSDITAQLANTLSGLARSFAMQAPVMGIEVGFGIIASKWQGYGKESEIKADGGALSLLQRSNFRAEALTEVLEKLQLLERSKASSGQRLYSHLVSASPGLDVRINASKTTLERLR